MSSAGPDCGERLDVFMGRANALYYATRDPFADFVTAPEVSQIFGELLGAWCAVVMDTLGPDVRLVEVGPGRGTLMADMLRVLTRIAPSRLARLSVHLVETSPRLRRAQEQALAQFAVQVQWHDALGDVPEGPILLVGNEFLDALPIRQFVRTETGWLERYVQDGQWALQACPDVPLDVTERGAAPGEVIETCPAGQAFMRELGRRVSEAPGAALLIDYGTSRSCVGESLQALRQGQPVSALVEPGTADLTAHVDFAGMARAAAKAGAVCDGPVEQGAFLIALGAIQRADALCKVAPAQAGSVRTGLDRLIGPERMGRLFKVLGVRSPRGSPLPGFLQEHGEDT
ncbi:class I SAM-dependent methyltransferase [Acetobacter estunensis]|uniref:class I SAM-dependent methyltransferase n=1 Tax=Acetobacter estunensis TaxID=104097 RepID=UPI001C2CC8CF|nr:SAM-dependent methyltransferase [Acetobacter estunensis]MBV1837959.1 SAM-dependent methyltransferase [Acetobacter estunensis]